MATYQKWAPFPIVGSQSTNSFGNVTATANIGNGYTAAGADLTHAVLALCRLLVEHGFDPTTQLTVGAVTFPDIQDGV